MFDWTKVAHHVWLVAVEQYYTSIHGQVYRVGENDSVHVLSDTVMDYRDVLSDTGMDYRHVLSDARMDYRPMFWVTLGWIIDRCFE